LIDQYAVAPAPVADEESVLTEFIQQLQHDDGPGGAEGRCKSR
jgi:hypothetical protein